MVKEIMKTVYVDFFEVADQCDDEAAFLAKVLNELGKEPGLTDAWLRDFAAELTDDGEAALRSFVARLDRIDASSTEGAR